ncbi:hypothetical protein LCGC14_0165540 [marine sediment metagenome]|uniref:Uncharacterized protein n=1 Tax=marine sediment metagenome TaxID=412755 RepID=A0A0F9XD42_9ZZZZ
MALRIAITVSGVDESVTQTQFDSLLEAIRAATSTELAINFVVDSSAVGSTQAASADDDPTTEDDSRVGTVVATIS